MNKNEFIDRVSDLSKMSKADATRAVDAVFDAITQALKRGDDVRLVGFGTFSAAKREARDGRNPRTGETIKIPASCLDNGALEFDHINTPFLIYTEGQLEAAFARPNAPENTAKAVRSMPMMSAPIRMQAIHTAMPTSFSPSS